MNKGIHSVTISLFIIGFIKILDCTCTELINECDSNPCQNGGTCSDRDNAYECQCADGYSGSDCSVSACLENCKTCTISDSVKRCTACNSNYYLQNDECLACPKHCKTCTISDSVTRCTACDSNHFLANNDECLYDDCTYSFKDPEICERGRFCLISRCFLVSRGEKTRAESEKFCSPLVDNKLSDEELQAFEKLVEDTALFWLKPVRTAGTESFLWSDGSVVDNVWDDVPNRPYLQLVIDDGDHSLDAAPNSSTALDLCEERCTKWVQGLDNDEPCAVNAECGQNEMVVQFRSTDFPMIKGKSEAYCEVNGNKVFFEESSHGNSSHGNSSYGDLTLWQTEGINNSQITQKISDIGLNVYSVSCYILYAGEKIQYKKNKQFTAHCTHDYSTDAVITYSLQLDNTEEDVIEDVEAFYTSDPTVHMSICAKDEAKKNCTMNTDISIGEQVCLIFWSDQAIEDLQIVQMSFSSASGNNTINVYEGCERTEDILIEYLFEPEPQYNEKCSYNGVENCPRLRMQCFNAFSFKDESTMTVSVTLRKSQKLNDKKSCPLSPKRRRRDINFDDSEDEEEDIVMSVNLIIRGDFMTDVNEIIRAYQDEINSPLTEAASIGVLTGSGLLIMIVIFIIYTIKYKKVKMIAIDTRKGII